MRRIKQATSLAALPFLLILTGCGGGEERASEGQLLFQQCAACHTLSASAPARLGPHLEKVIGRAAGSLPDFAYSDAMKGAKLTWDEATLDRFLARPDAVVPGTSMVFEGIPDAAKRRALIDHLKRQAP